MALSRRTGARFQGAIWPGFVDAMTGLLLVLMFVLTIFMIVQFVLREEISGQASRLDTLSAEVAALSRALGLAEDRNASLQDRVGVLTATLGDARTRATEQAALIARLRAQGDEQAAALEEARGHIASFEEQVASLLAERDHALGRVADLEGAQADLLDEQAALNLALAGLREEVDEQAEAARLAAARREALEALVADLRAREAEAGAAQAALEERLSEEEAARIAEAAAAEALRARLEGAQTELTAMTLALEAERRRAEETLTLLAATEAVRDDLDARLAQALLGLEGREAEIGQLETALADARAGAQTAEELRARLVAALAAQRAAEAEAEDRLSAAQERAVLLSEARARLAQEAAISEAARREQALLNSQVAALRTQLSELQALLDDARDREAEAEVQLQSLGNELNTALARVAAEERRRRQAEEERAALLQAEAERLAAEKADLERYRSDFFGRMREILGQQEGVRIVGDRFVFSSEVLFAPGEAELSEAGQREIAGVARLLGNVIDEIPPEIDWILQVDGHTDTVPLMPGARFADNWALSQARALSVVRYLATVLGFPARRLSANGYGEYQPLNPADTPEARAQNRRIELKLTTR
ncbi:peptidoglycan -binding protein [Roseovarius autotrophicus]|uniref:peptidoglycan -binding protein n=1 Tax=Roseovarius autotrophicus TaxID=2824121 RepID=UPI001A0DFD4B|nr:peptidoglycan -binding protein [Roseovarius autotrophicus]MBE0454695.1 peptidoglycan -binding protein [Roseovarius sp.]